MEPDEQVTPPQPTPEVPAPDAPAPEAPQSRCVMVVLRGQGESLEVHVAIDPKTMAALPDLPPIFLASATVHDIILGKPHSMPFKVSIKAETLEEAWANREAAIKNAVPTVLEALRQQVTRNEIQRSPQITDFRLHREGRGKENGGRKRRF